MKPPCKITINEALNGRFNTQTQQIIQTQWLLWYDVGPKRFNPTKRVSPSTLQPLHPKTRDPPPQQTLDPGKLLEDNDGNISYVLHTPEKLTDLEVENPPFFEKENHLNQTFIFGLHVNFQGCMY